MIVLLKKRMMRMKMNHEQFMELALQEAEKAVKQGEVPIGAVIVKGWMLPLMQKSSQYGRPAKNYITGAFPAVPCM